VSLQNTTEAIYVLICYEAIKALPSILTIISSTPSSSLTFVNTDKRAISISQVMSSTFTFA
jgi:hypothetical protein